MVGGDDSEAVPRTEMRACLAQFAIASAWRAADTDPTEEIILISATDFARVNVHELTAALMDVLPHTKVWVIKANPMWKSEPL
jgi:hypothetical protein